MTASSAIVLEQPSPERSHGAAVVVRVGAAAFGLPVGAVREVLRSPPIARVPFAPPGVCGAVAVRGTILPILDMGVHLFRRAVERPGTVVIVALADGAEPIGLLVDAVTGLLDADTAASVPPPMEAEATLPRGWVSQVLVTAGRPVAVLDLVRVLDGGHTVVQSSSRGSNSTSSGDTG